MPSTIYFIPGTMCDERLWQATWQLLREQYKIHCQLVHLPIPTVGNMDEVVAEMAKKVVAKQAILVGFSLGGYLASAIALKMPDVISHLVIVSNLPKNLPDGEIKQRKRTVAWIKKYGYSGIPDKRINDLVHPNIKQNNADNYDSLKSIMLAMDVDLGGEVLLHQLQVSMHRPNLLDDLSALALPITFLVGDADALVDFSLLENSICDNENMMAYHIDNTGHMLPLESPQVLAGALIKLLNV